MYSLCACRSTCLSIPGPLSVLEPGTVSEKFPNHGLGLRKDLYTGPQDSPMIPMSIFEGRDYLSQLIAPQKKKKKKKLKAEFLHECHSFLFSSFRDLKAARVFMKHIACTYVMVDEVQLARH